MDKQIENLKKKFKDNIITVVLSIILIASISINAYVIHFNKCECNNNTNLKEDSNGFKESTNNNDSNKKENTNDGTEEPSATLVKNAHSKGLKQAIADEIKYFDNADNFSKKETYNSYQKYVNKLKNANLSGYTESDKKVNVYMFAGESCWHCLDEITWLASNVNEFKQYANIVVYEVWNDKDNSKLMKRVTSTLQRNTSGVPFTIVGNKTFVGFTEEYGKNIVDEIKNLYNSNEKYDVIQELSK